MISNPTQRCAVDRGLNFVYRTACVSENFEDYGFDYLNWFSSIFSTAKDSYLRRTALKICCEQTRLWRETHPSIPPEVDADTVTQFVFANEAAQRIGMRDGTMKSHIRRIAEHFSPIDYFWFDPTVEGPPCDLPVDCECGADNSRGCRICHKCQEPLSMMSRYEVWLVALIRSYIGERYGIVLGSRYAHVLKWLPAMRPYSELDTSYSELIWAVYAVTHVVYTLNDYGVYKLSSQWLPQEFEFLKKQLPTAIDMDDPETVGEILDSLKSFGLTRRDSLIRRGEEFILSRQNPDGSWGEVEVDDIYERYHPTIAAIDGLKRTAWRGIGLSFPNVKPFLEHFAGLAASL